MYIHPLEREDKNVTGGCVNFYINSTIFNALAQAFYNDKLKYILKEMYSTEFLNLPILFPSVSFTYRK